MPLILGRPFLSTTNANIDVGKGEIRFEINGEIEMFLFCPHYEVCKKVTMTSGVTKSYAPLISKDHKECGVRRVN